MRIDGHEKKLDGIFSHILEGMGLHSRTDGGTIQRSGSPSIQEHQCFESWNSEEKNNKDTIHLNADVSNIELLIRTIHSVNQFSIYGAVARWCEEFGLRLNEREPTSERFVIKENEQFEECVTAGSNFSNN